MRQSRKPGERDQRRFVFYKHDIGAWNEPERKRGTRRAPPGVNPLTGEIGKGYTPHSVKERLLTFAFGEKKPEALAASPIRYGRQAVKPLAHPIGLLIAMCLFTLVIAAGFIINGGNIVKHYSDDTPRHASPDWIQDYYGNK